MNQKSKVEHIENKDIPEPHPVTVEFVKKLEIQEGKKYILFIDSKNLEYESARDLARAMAVQKYTVSIVLTDGDPNVLAVEGGGIQGREVITEENNEQS